MILEIFLPPSFLLLSYSLPSSSHHPLYFPRTPSPLLRMAQAIADADFDAEVLKAEIPVLVDFWAEWRPLQNDAPDYRGAL